MGLSQTDCKPEGITLNEAHAKVRHWYQNNKTKCGAQDQDYVQRSFALIDHLPEPAVPSELEIRAVLGEVIYGNLEWAYHETDGDFKMAAYAHAALEQAGFHFSLNEQEKHALQHGSSIWPYLSISRSP
jgi:hypothetical protein